MGFQYYPWAQRHTGFTELSRAAPHMVMTCDSKRIKIKSAVGEGIELKSRRNLETQGENSCFIYIALPKLILYASLSSLCLQFWTPTTGLFSSWNRGTNNKTKLIAIGDEFVSQLLGPFGVCV